MDRQHEAILATHLGLAALACMGSHTGDWYLVKVERMVASYSRICFRCGFIETVHIDTETVKRMIPYAN